MRDAVSRSLVPDFAVVGSERMLQTLILVE